MAIFSANMKCKIRYFCANSDYKEHARRPIEFVKLKDKVSLDYKFVHSNISSEISPDASLL